MWKRWDDVSLQTHARFVMAMLATGILLSIAGSLLDLQTAWIVAVVAMSCALGAQLRLSMRLTGDNGLGVANTP